MSTRRLDWLAGGGAMAEFIASLDWAATPLGPIESWPQSLRTTVSLCLASNFPINIIWGPSHNQIYNDGYRVVCGAVHPRAMGEDYRVTWASAWPAIGEPFERARAGETTFLENQRMFLERNGYQEETFFTFSLSPIRSESGEVAGLFHPVTETTQSMLAARRTRALRDIADNAGRAAVVDRACELLLTTLETYAFDVPFAALYLAASDDESARLHGSRGAAAGSALAPPTVALQGDGGTASWPLREAAIERRAYRVDGVESRFGAHPAGTYPEPIATAFVLPLHPAGMEAPLGYLVVGASPRLPLNDAYFGFIEMLGAASSAALGNAHAYEIERLRADALAALDRAKTTFFSNVSHEFRTPLTLILGPLEDALGDSPQSLHGDALASVQRNALRLLRLVNSLLDFSRVEASRVESRFEPTDLATFTADLAGSFQSLVDSAGLRLTIDCPPLLDPIYVDRSQWEKIVLNLISNAFKFTFQGEIAVRLRATQGQIELEVADTGTGIPATELPRIFERFHRVESAEGRSFEGTGIGLALVQDLVSQHAGSVRVTSALGTGTTFVVCIPRGNDHLPKDRVSPARGSAAPGDAASPFVLEAAHWLAAAPANADKGPKDTSPRASDRPTTASLSPSGPTAGMRVLVADDNADMRDYLVRLLSSRWAIEAVVDGQAALESALQRPPDLILSDVMMPRLDGVALLRELRANAKTSMIPVVLLSARAGEEEVISGLDTGADDYLVKPFSARELLSRVATHLEMGALRRHATEAAAALAETRAALLQDLERKNRELEAFSYSVSHDLRAPLRGIEGFSQILLEDCSDALGPAGRDHLQRVRALARRMNELIDDLLELSRVERAAVRQETLDLSSIARRIGESLAKSNADRNVEFVVEDGLVANGDARLVEVLLENLLGNAWKFTSKVGSPRIEVGSLHEDGETRLFVRDNGAGFDPACAERLFTPFQRLHGAGEFPGTGIGLATVRRIVERHGGRVWAQGSVGHGATVSWTLAAPRGADQVPS